MTRNVPERIERRGGNERPLMFVMLDVSSTVHHSVEHLLRYATIYTDPGPPRTPLC